MYMYSARVLDYFRVVKGCQGCRIKRYGPPCSMVDVGWISYSSKGSLVATVAVSRRLDVVDKEVTNYLSLTDNRVERSYDSEWFAIHNCLRNSISCQRNCAIPTNHLLSSPHYFHCSFNFVDELKQASFEQRMSFPLIVFKAPAPRPPSTFSL
ncbi:hypothetical protein J6590_037450 [Homalodisca vitripennis]|nr:hypothetical protein J6590_037450 [Homalodisca vitripennis]